MACDVNRYRVSFVINDLFITRVSLMIGDLLITRLIKAVFIYLFVPIADITRVVDDGSGRT